MAAREPKEPSPVSAYKSMLRTLIDRRPSGTRLRIAQALGKHKSFVSQITNPAYTVPVPARHLAKIFEICHFSPDERRQFLEAYRSAHPGRRLLPLEPHPAASSVVIEVPPFKDPARQEEVVEAIKLYAEHAIDLAKRWDERAATTAKGRKKS